jgi:hypothetical protein
MAVSTGKVKMDLDSDAIWGLKGIGEVIGANVRRTHHLLSTGALAETGARVVGGRWLASRRKLQAFIQGDTGDE